MMLPCVWRSFVVACLFFSLPPIYAQDKGTKKPKRDDSKLTVQRIYGGGEFRSPSYSVRWEREGSNYLRFENAARGGGRDLVQYDAESGVKRIFVAADQFVADLESGPLVVSSYELSKDESQVLIFTNTKRVWRRHTRGDYWVLDRSSSELKKLGRDFPASTLMFAKFSPDGTRVAYVHDGDIYVEDVTTGKVNRVTRKRTSSHINGTSDWVYEEELSVRDGFRWSPDGNHIAFWSFDTTGVREVNLIDNLAGLYPKTIPIKYPKTGQRNSACRVGVVNVHDFSREARGYKTVWLQIPGDPREHYLARIHWTPDSAAVMVEQLNRLQNTNRMFVGNVESGDQVEELFAEKDDAWVNVHDEMKWLDDERFSWISERDGWRHVYIVDRSGKLTLITPGDFDVSSLLKIDTANNFAYFIASPDNATQRYLYSVRLDGTDLKRLTPEEFGGTNSYSISADGKFATHTHSAFDQPPKISLVRLPSHEVVRELEKGDKYREKIDTLKLGSTEFFRVDIGDGIELDGYCIKPVDFDASKKYPLLVYVYGEPAGQTAVDRWGGSTYLWHQMLAQQGYVVMNFDNQGTPAPRGRDWRRAVYRQVGIIAPKQQAAALRAMLEERSYLDPERVGVWGWSGGGSMTLNALFKFPDLYRMGISIAPVPNMRFYDTIYQERYMGLPSSNAANYKQGSPIHFAHQLQGNLLLIHGTGDDNCHYQTTEQLIDRLIRHNKRFSMMAYPNRTHSIREGKNTTLHLRHLMTNYLLENLPAGGK